MLEVVVASKNPVKIASTKTGFLQMFPGQEFHTSGISAPSDVRDQPMTEEETLTGATNRANNVSLLSPDADYWVGIEGGLSQIDNGMITFAWVVIKAKSGQLGKGRTAAFVLPAQMVDLINAGKELGEADDIVFGVVNSKQTNGTVGNLTADVITRTTLYVPAVILALIPFKNQELYK